MGLSELRARTRAGPAAEPRWNEDTPPSVPPSPCGDPFPGSGAVSPSAACGFAPNRKTTRPNEPGRVVPGATPRFAALRSARLCPLRSTPRSTFGRGSLPAELIPAGRLGGRTDRRKERKRPAAPLQGDWPRSPDSRAYGQCGAGTLPTGRSRLGARAPGMREFRRDLSAPRIVARTVARRPTRPGTLPTLP